MQKLKIFGKRNNGLAASSAARVVFVSHEATRTGAPKIILNIIRRFAQVCDVQCETIVHDEGHLSAEFQAVSRMECLSLPRQRSIELQKRVRQFVLRKNAGRPILAICNSMESRFVAEQLAELDIPLISLVHELPCSYSDSDYQLIYKVSDKIVFPVRSVRELTNKKYPIPFGKDEVIPQGLLNPEFGKSIQTSEARRRIRAELGLSADAFIVLGCGTLDMRKGIDHFAAIARQVGRSREGKHPIHFVWVGDGPKWPHSTYHYVQIDLRLNGSDHVHFVGEREHVDPYFVGADLFLLPSRVDPFPCVVHEAMAVQLPVLSFDSSGGAVEALAGGCGFVIPYADYVAAAGLIASLARDPQMADGQKAKALQRVQNLYRFERYADRIIDLAESVAGKRLRYNPAASPTAENRAA